MPLFQADIHKTLGQEGWANVYYVACETLTQAAAFAQDMAAMEATFHDAAVRFDVARVRSTIENDEVYTTVALGYQGAISIDRGGLLPLFNTLRVDLPALVGRPSRKYYRGVLAEADITFNNVSASMIAAVNSAIDNVRTGQPEDWVWVDLDDTPITGQVVWPLVQMRQLKRRRKKKTATTPTQP